MEKGSWTCALELGAERAIAAGGAEALCEAIGRGADLRIQTAFRHNEHIDVASDSGELVREVAEFRATYLIDGRWAAGIMTLRQPIGLPDGFGPRPSMSFFLYNQDGRQAIARPYLDGESEAGMPGVSAVDDHADMPKYHEQDSWDGATNAPSRNFVYDFDVYRYWVRDDWREVLAHAADGAVISGSVEALAEAVERGSEIKVGIRNLCGDLADDSGGAVEHEVFIQVGSCYYYTGRKVFIGATHPIVRVKPGIPLGYSSGGWDFGWLMVRTDGHVARWLVDPYTLKFIRSDVAYGLRWFVRG